MYNLLIDNIKKIKMNYEIKKIDDLMSKGYARLEAGVKILDENSDEKYKLAHVSFDFTINSKETEENEATRDNAGAKLSLTYRVLFNQKDKNKEIKESDLLYYLEPYARKEINDMLYEIGIPAGIIPYGFWENDK